MIKKLTSSAFLTSALSAGSLFFCSCDSSVSNGFGIFDDEDNRDDVTAAVSGKGIHSDFQPIVDRFVIEANNRGVSVNLNGLDIQYGFTDGAYGVCSSLEGNSKDIVIDPTVAESTDDFRSEIILHELGHCILGRDHNNDPNSLMHTTLIIGEPWREELLDELFTL